MKGQSEWDGNHKNQGDLSCPLSKLSALKQKMLHAAGRSNLFGDTWEPGVFNSSALANLFKGHRLLFCEVNRTALAQAPP